MMTTFIGTFEAQTRLPELLERVAAGERFVITRRGQPVASLVPAGVGRLRPSVEQLIDAARVLREDARVDPGEIRSWIEERRR